MPNIAFPNEPGYFTPDQLDRLLVHAHQQNASDITIQTGEVIYAEIEGAQHHLTQRPITLQEVQDIINHIYGANASAMVFSGTDIDTNYRVKLSPQEEYRYRVNMTACIYDGYQGVQVTLRTLSASPPSLADLDLESDVLETVLVPQGVVIVSGATGSGKSTLLASIISDIAQREESHLKILTYESPIEYVYDKIKKPTSIISQTEIPRYLPDFAMGVRNALRRKPGLIMVGEARDQETIEAVIDAAMTGHPVYTTVHSNGVADTLRRMVTIFPYVERDTRFFDLLESVKLIIWQALVPNPKGGRTALREYLEITPDIRDALLKVPLEEIVLHTRKLIEKHGQTIAQAAEKKFKQGEITKACHQRFTQRKAT